MTIDIFTLEIVVISVSVVPKKPWSKDMCPLLMFQKVGAIISLLSIVIQENSSQILLVIVQLLLIKKIEKRETFFNHFMKKMIVFINYTKIGENLYQ